MCWEIGNDGGIVSLLSIVLCRDFSDLFGRCPRIDEWLLNRLVRVRGYWSYTQSGRIIARDENCWTLRCDGPCAPSFRRAIIGTLRPSPSERVSQVASRVESLRRKPGTRDSVSVVFWRECDFSLWNFVQIRRNHMAFKKITKGGSTRLLNQIIRDWNVFAWSFFVVRQN